MPFHSKVVCGLLACALPFAAWAQSGEPSVPEIHLELNTVSTVGDACRLTFVAHNRTGTDIEQAVFETVVFDTSGSVQALSLFDFRDLPSDRPRVRQFDVPGMGCEILGQALINGASTCTAGGTESALCNDALSLSSRIDVDLLG